jgi:hypothetical protein
MAPVGMDEEISVRADFKTLTPRLYGRLRWVSAPLIIALMGFGVPHSLSGTYIARETGGAVMLQLTENQSQQLMGSMTVVSLDSNGVLEERGISIIGGTTDGLSLTITVKVNQLFSQAVNFVGRVANGGIDLTMGTATAHFSPASPKAFNALVTDLAAAGQEQERRQTLTQLAQELNSYCKKVEAHAPSAKPVHDTEQKLLRAARHDLILEHAFNSQSFQAGQVRFRIGQLAFQLGQIKFKVDGAIPEWRAQIQRFDARLAANPCNANAHLAGCEALASAQRRYKPVRMRVLNEAKEFVTDMEQSEAEMIALNEEAGN